MTAAFLVLVALSAQLLSLACSEVAGRAYHDKTPDHWNTLRRAAALLALLALIGAFLAGWQL